MPLKVIKGDITTLKVDAIVNAANKELEGGGGVDGAIHLKAGPLLDEACKLLAPCETGEAKLTSGFNLPAKYIIHTVGPIYVDGFHNEETLLKKCYISSLNIAKKNNFRSIAFPLISSGVYGYPKKEAFNVAKNTIKNFLETYPNLEVYIVLYDQTDFIVLDL